jgi:hypothetical protein
VIVVVVLLVVVPVLLGWMVSHLTSLQMLSFLISVAATLVMVVVSLISLILAVRHDHI